MKKLYIAIVLLFLANNTYAGFNNLTEHSRANCINNESISWDATAYHVLGTVSKHYLHGKWMHDVNTGWQNTWRSAAVHWGEARPGSGWQVIGYHWMVVNGVETLIFLSNVLDCSIYDGWWDKN